MLPGIAYYLSRWYRRSELTFRLALYIVMAPLAGAFGGLLATAILKLPQFGSLHNWRMIFAIEGIITCGISLLAFFTVTDCPATAKWLSAEEKNLAASRLKAERRTNELLDKMDRKKMIRGVLNPNTLATALIFLFNNITVQGLAFFAPTSVRTIYPKATVAKQQLHTVPPYLVGAFFNLFIPFMSWKLDKRLPFFILSAPLTITGYVIFLASSNPNVRYGATFLIGSGVFPFGALCNAHVSANVISDTSRSTAIATTVMFGNIGGLISTWSFLDYDSPNYHIGNGLNLATSSMTLMISIGLLVWMKADNKRRAHEDINDDLAGLTDDQIEDLDWLNPAFRWKS
jgi:sugar phosphate permease